MRALLSAMVLSAVASSCVVSNPVTLQATVAATYTQAAPLPSTEATLSPTPLGTPQTLVMGDLPPGTYLAYCSIAEEDLSDPDAWPSVFVSSLEGHVLGRLTHRVCGRSDLAPDGRTLAIEVRPDGPSGSPSVLVMDLATGESRLLRASSGCTFPSWSPNSREVLVSCDLDIFVLDIESDTSVPIAECREAATACTNPEWSPDGRVILFFRAIEFAPNPGLYRIGAGCLQEPTTCFETATFFASGTPPYSWSPTANELAYVTFTGDLGIATSAGHLLRAIPIPDDNRIKTLSWSPDAKSLAVTLDSSDKGRVSYLVPIDGGDWTPLTTLSANAYILFWWEVP
jgi:Tol biopolymer transport system component